MLCCQSAARILLIDIGPVGDANQCIVRLVHFRIGKIHIISGDHRHAVIIGQFQMPPFDLLFGLSDPTVRPMAL